MFTLHPDNSACGTASRFGSAAIAKHWSKLVFYISWTKWLLWRHKCKINVRNLQAIKRNKVQSTHRLCPSWRTTHDTQISTWRNSWLQIRLTSNFLMKSISTAIYPAIYFPVYAQIVVPPNAFLLYSIYGQRKWIQVIFSKFLIIEVI